MTTDYINWKNQHCKWGGGGEGFVANILWRVDQLLLFTGDMNPSRFMLGLNSFWTWFWVLKSADVHTE